MELLCCVSVGRRKCKKLPTKKCLSSLEYYCTFHGNGLELYIINDAACLFEKERRRIQRRTPTLPEINLPDNRHEDDDSEYIDFVNRKKKESQARNDLLEQVYKDNEECISDSQCCICLLCIPFDDEMQCIICKTGFHSICIDVWIQINSNCPICRIKF